VIKLQPNNVLALHSSKLEVYTSIMDIGSHHPTGITLEIVGIESGTNGRSCYQHDVCGSVIEEDVVVRLRKIQTRNNNGKEETAVAAFHVTDGIDQCHVGFLPRHFVPHASSFDGVLAQVTEVYSPTSESSSKRKKFRHNMGCCQARLITELPARAAQANKTTGVFLSKIDRECEDDHSDGEDVLDDHHNTGVALQGGFLRYDDRGAMTATATATTATRTEHAVAASSEECITPPASTKKVAAKKKSQDLTPSKRSNRVIDKDKRSRSTKSKPQVLDLTASVSPKKPAWRKMTQEVMAPPPAATTVAKKRKKRKRISLAPARKKAVGRIGMAVHEGWSEKNVREL
jgi:hypothetical protein